MTVISSSLYFIDSSLLPSRFFGCHATLPQKKAWMPILTWTLSPGLSFSLAKKHWGQGFSTPWIIQTWSKLIKQASFTASRFIRDCKNENSLSDYMWIMWPSKVLSFRRETNERGKHARARARTRDTEDTRREVNALAGTILSHRNKGLPAV